MNMNPILFIIYCPICIGGIIACSIFLGLAVARAVISKMLSRNIIGYSNREATRYVSNIKITHRKTHGALITLSSDFINKYGLEGSFDKSLEEDQ